MKPTVIKVKETSGHMLTALRNGVKLFSMHKRFHKAFYRRVHELEDIIRRASAAAQARVNEFMAMMRLMYICRALARLVAPEPLVVAEPEIMPTVERMPDDEYQTLTQDIELGTEVMKFVKGEPCNPQIILKGLGIDVEQKRDYLPIQ